MKLQVTSHSPEETLQFGKQLVGTVLSDVSKKPIIFAVEGEMGMGKTQLAKGIALGLGIEKIVSSPTFVLVKEYVAPSGIRFVHMDGWRLEKVNPKELGFEDYIKPNTVILIEWPAVVNTYLKELKNAMVYAVTFTDQIDNNRVIEVHAL